MIKIKNKQFNVKKFNLKVQKMFMKAQERFTNVENPTAEDLDLLEDLIIIAYGHQFEKEDLEEELDQADLMQEFMNIISDAKEIMEDKIKQISNTLESKFGNVAK